MTTTCDYDDYRRIHKKVRTILRRRNKKLCIMDDAGGEAEEFLLGLEVIRMAAFQMMGTATAELTADILLSVAGKVRRIKTKRMSEAEADFELFNACQDDEAAYVFIDDWLTRGKWH